MEPIHVLLVEDNEETGEALAMVLSMDSFAVRWAHTSHEAIGAIDASMRHDVPAIDVVVLDLMLPDTNGVEVAAHLGRTGSHAPVIMHSAASIPVLRGAAEAAGAAAWLRKPVECDVLRDTIRRVAEAARIAS